jgi:hypothetical protein
MSQGIHVLDTKDDCGTHKLTCLNLVMPSQVCFAKLSPGVLYMRILTEIDYKLVMDNSKSI